MKYSTLIELEDKILTIIGRLVGEKFFHAQES